jgi:hypothetical protein
VTPVEQDRAIGNPVGLITDLITAADPGLAPDRIHSIVVTVTGGRAKSRRLAAALASRPGVLLDGRSPAPRAVGELLGGLAHGRRNGDLAAVLRRMRQASADLHPQRARLVLQPCEHRRAPCAGCGKTKRVKALDRNGQPRCAQCCDVDDRDPISVIHSVVAELDPQVDRDTIAAAVDQSCRQRAYQQKLAWAIESDPALLTGEGHRAPLRVIPRLIERLHAAGIAGIDAAS